MTGALRYEWARLTTIRSTWWLTGLALGLSFVMSMLLAWGVSSTLGGTALAADPNAQALVLTQAASTGVVPLMVAFLMGVLGVLAFGHEYRHGMIRATLTAVPQRVPVMLAKLVTTMVWSAAVSVGCLVLGAVAGYAFLGGDGFSVGTDQIPRVMAGTFLYTVVFTLVGLALASLVRSQVAALGVLLIVPLVIEPVVRLIIVIPDQFDSIEGVTRYFPFDAGSQMLVLTDLGNNLGPAPLGPAAGMAVFAVFTAILLAVATALFISRDA